MSKSLPWSRRNKTHTKRMLKRIGDAAGGWQALADSLGMTAESSRSTVQSWHARGRVPLTYVGAIRETALKHGISCEASELAPLPPQLGVTK